MSSTDGIGGGGSPFLWDGIGEADVAGPPAEIAKSQLSEQAAPLLDHPRSNISRLGPQPEPPDNLSPSRIVGADAAGEEIRLQSQIIKEKLSALLPGLSLALDAMERSPAFEDPLTAMPRATPAFEDPLTAMPRATPAFEDPLTAAPNTTPAFEDPLTARE